ncbi:transglutaminase-like domain-containing protein [Namhaeicola litoreus]|uniref:Transglutaminase family protein n=1 Tax=Namhaeicola litoreus TaxID=1052145 RepID=A0ABW3Y2Q0_9FLAO
MEVYKLVYQIKTTYNAPVKKANFQLLVIPFSNAEQIVEDLEIECSIDQDAHISKNSFGFDLIHYYAKQSVSEFWFHLSAVVKKEKKNPFPISSLTSEQEFELLNSLDFKIDHHRFLLATDLTKMPVHSPISFPVYSSEKILLEYLLELNMFIFELLEYSPNSTDVNTAIEQVLYLKKGVCQDYAHLFISVCRQNKIPARYVSGYLDQGEGSIDTSQLHAWVEAFIPEAGWVGFDATNHLLADHHYIKIAHGCDFRDCSPIVGILETIGMQKSIHAVTITNQ